MKANRPPKGWVPEGATVVFLGDSITEDPHGYVSICAKQLPGRRVVNAGVSGNKASDMLARLDSDVLSHKPDLVLISVGVNDVWHGFYDFEADAPLPEYDSERALPLPQFKEAVSTMLTKLKGIPTILISPTVIGDDPASRENRMLTEYVAAMESLAQSHKAGYCPMHERYWQFLSEHPDQKLTTDGVHMGPVGAAMMASVVLDCLGVAGQ